MAKGFKISKIGLRGTRGCTRSAKTELHLGSPNNTGCYCQRWTTSKNVFGNLRSALKTFYKNTEVKQEKGVFNLMGFFSDIIKNLLKKYVLFVQKLILFLLHYQKFI